MGYPEKLLKAKVFRKNMKIDPFLPSKLSVELSGERLFKRKAVRKSVPGKVLMS